MMPFLLFTLAYVPFEKQLIVNVTSVRTQQIRQIIQTFLFSIAPQTLYVCELTSAVLSCPFSTVLSVTTAYWGRDDANRCGSGRPTLPNCRLDVTSDIKKRCEGHNHCSLRASNSFSSDPCAGVSKYLEINYVCKNGEWSHYAGSF